MKLFKTNNIDVINYCRMQFNSELPSVTVLLRNVVKNLQISIGSVTMLFVSRLYFVKCANDVVYFIIFLSF